MHAEGRPCALAVVGARPPGPPPPPPWPADRLAVRADPPTAEPQPHLGARAWRILKGGSAVGARQRVPLAVRAARGECGARRGSGAVKRGARSPRMTGSSLADWAEPPQQAPMAAPRRGAGRQAYWPGAHARSAGEHVCSGYSPRQLYFHFVSYISNGGDRRNVVRSSRPHAVRTPPCEPRFEFSVAVRYTVLVLEVDKKRV